MIPLRALVLATVAILLLARPSAGTQTSMPLRESVDQVSVTTTMHYLVQTPDGYGDDPEKSWPLVLFLHGSGERGTDISRVKVNGPPKMLSEGKKLPAVVVSPQCPADRWWDPVAVLAVLDDVIAKHTIDARRVYLTGLSMGGYAAWTIAAEHPERFAAIAPICGGMAGPEHHLERLKDVPIWAFHGADDPVVPVSQTIDAVEAVRAAGGKPKLTVYEGVGHDSWVPAYEDEGFWRWLFAQRRGD